MGMDADGVTPIFSEEVTWKPQNSQTSTTFNDVYCVMSADGGAESVRLFQLICMYYGMYHGSKHATY